MADKRKIESDCLSSSIKRQRLEKTNHDFERNWVRPPVDLQEIVDTDISFLKTEIDYRLNDDQSTVIRIFGVTECGNSIAVFVNDVVPYFYVETKEIPDCDLFRLRLNNIMLQDDKTIENQVLDVSIEYKTDIIGYNVGVQPFIKISLIQPKLIYKCKEILSKGFDYGRGTKNYKIYESNIHCVLRFMIDNNISGFSWITILAGNYKLKKKKNTLAQIEIYCNERSIMGHKPEGKWLKQAPIRILSFDIECAGRKNIFPEAQADPVIQIANLLTILGESKHFEKNVFTVRGCSDIIGANVLSFEHEQQMLRSWRDFVQKADPDIIIGYNIANFDFPYLIDRAEHLHIKDFFFLGRVLGEQSKVKDQTFESKAFGKSDTKSTSMSGRCIFDIHQVIKREYKLRSYTLNAVSAVFLNEQKEDLHHSMITVLYNGDDDDRRRLAVYCIKDTYLPQRLSDKLMLLVNYIEMCRVTGVPFNYLIVKGQQIKVISQLYRKAVDENYLIPDYEISNIEEKYAGATVIPPKRGFYTKPVTTLDFTSLYPSIMIGRNLCYTTLLSRHQVASMDPSLYEKTPTGNYFVKGEVRKGLLPQILCDLLEARQKAKLDLKNETDPSKKAVLDGRQLALKISANSVYGFTGATIGRLPCLEISASVTGYGREMIEFTKNQVESIFTIQNGYEYNAEVIYGDTDSVMVIFGTSDMKEAMRLGRLAAKIITESFNVKPINLDFEKVYYPFLLINKKRYAGLFWTKPEMYDKMDMKGIETVRRDNCPLVKNCIMDCLNKILIDRDVDGAVSYVKGIISDLLQNRMDLSLLVISKSLARKENEYCNKQAHASLVERMRKRDPKTAPNVGDRVPYVIVQNTKKSKTFEKSEDPLYVLENNIPIDHQYYIQNQLKKPLCRIFGPIMKDPLSIINGDHTRSVYKPTPLVGIAMYANKKDFCLNCRSTNLDAGSAVCKSCMPNVGEIYYKHLANVTDLENKYNKAWTQCQRCSNSLHQNVICSNRDCPIFYTRTKLQKDLVECQNKLDRFEW